jgi:hypothetical protein
MYVVMEFVDGMTYWDYRRSHSLEEVTKLFESIAEAVRRIWKLKIPSNHLPSPLDGINPQTTSFPAPALVGHSIRSPTCKILSIKHYAKQDIVSG